MIRTTTLEPPIGVAFPDYFFGVDYTAKGPAPPRAAPCETGKTLCHIREMMV